MKLLIVDDNKQVRNFIKMVLKQAAGVIEYVECSNGEEAVQAYRTEHPDLVLMDIMMDKLDGLSALKLIHAFDSHSKVIIVSQLPETEYGQEVLELGAIAFLNKEFLFKLPQVIKTVQNGYCK